MQPHKTSPEQIKRITDIHIKRYTNRVALGKSGHPYLNLNECERLLSIWKSIENKKYEFSSLTQIEKDEVIDALCDEDSY